LFTFTEGNLILIPGIFVLIPAVPIAVLIWWRGSDRRRTWMVLLALLHFTLVVGLTIFPIPISGQDFYRDSRGLTGDNLIPLTTIIVDLLHPSLTRQIVGNLLALAPLAVYGPALWPAMRDWRRFAVVAVAFSVGIELTQYAGSVIEGFTYRVTDIDDVILNALGAVAAFFVWRRIEGWPVFEPLREVTSPVARSDP